MPGHEAMTYGRAYELRDELEGYDPEMELVDGLTAAHSLAAVTGAPKRFEQVIVFNGTDYRVRLDNEAAQRTLF